MTTADDNETPEVTEYDDRGNLIHSKDSDGYEAWREYDANDNMIYYRNSKGFEWWREYDANNNMIHYRNSNDVVGGQRRTIDTPQKATP